MSHQHVARVFTYSQQFKTSKVLLFFANYIKEIMSKWIKSQFIIFIL